MIGASSLAIVHSMIVGDARRGRAFCDAIDAVVRPGDIVVDVGSGSGLLALFACQAGAARVYAIERQRSLVPVIETLARANGCADRVTVVAGMAADVELPEQADVLVSELIGQLGVHEDAIHILADAAARFLRPGGRLVPSHLEVFVAPADSDAARTLSGPWTTDFFGLDLRAARPWFASAVHAADVTPPELLGASARVLGLALGASPPPPRVWSASIVLPVERAGSLNAVAGWFSLAMAPGRAFSTAPGEPATHWQQALLPLAEPIPVDAGDRVRLEIAVMLDPSLPVWSWRGDVERRGVVRGRFAHSTLDAFGQPPSTAAPRPTWRLEAAREVASAVDGRATVAQLAQRLRTRFGDRYPSSERALAEVAAILEALA